MTDTDLEASSNEAPVEVTDIDVEPLSNEVLSEVASSGTIINTAAGAAGASTTSPLIMPKPVPWLQQFRHSLRKNFLLLCRRPFLLFIMLTSSAWSVIAAAAAGRDPEEPLGPLTNCGTIERAYIEVLLSLPAKLLLWSTCC
jgi:hypothetical protein